ncbi:aspartyl protease 37 [Nymphaea colorata]|uniref:aspartyl protease 37 n=1 Tax=Nymphaea colorata TaxID=210225 RepID=UPI00129DE12E|nr:aspartyl protease 37 [Nymphaea colorata]
MAGPSEFLVKLSLGTPSSLYWAIIDAGSNLIWTTCCHCYNCHVKTPMFDPLQSSTYKNRRCSTSFCMELHDHRCTSDQLCCFRYSYSANSEVEGVLASEMLLFDNDNPDSALHKVPGLGRGPLSLVKQIGSSIENNSAGQLKFGEDALFSGTEDVQETPMASDGGEGKRQRSVLLPVFTEEHAASCLPVFTEERAASYLHRGLHCFTKEWAAPFSV